MIWEVTLIAQIALGIFIVVTLIEVYKTCKKIQNYIEMRTAQSENEMYKELSKTLDEIQTHLREETDKPQ